MAISPWEIGKDIAEVAGTVGTAIGIGLRWLVKSRIRDEKINSKLDNMGRQIEQLQMSKLDRATQEAENERLHELITDMRTDIKETTKDMSENMGKMAESLNKLDGTVRTFMQMLKHQ